MNRLHGFARLFTISQLITVFLVAMIALTGITVGTVYVYQAEIRDNGHAIDVAGEERMLSESMARFANQKAANDTGNATGELRAAMEQYEQNLRALETGGTIDGQPVPAPPPEAAAELQRQRDEWEALRPHVETVIDSDPDSAAFRVALSVLNANLQSLVTSSDRTVDALAANNRRQIVRMQRILLALFALNLALFGVGVVATRRYVGTALSEVTAALETIAGGSFETEMDDRVREVATIHDERTANEVVTLVAAFERMEDSLRTVANQARALADQQFDASVLDEEVPGEMGAAVESMQQDIEGLITDLEAAKERAETSRQTLRQVIDLVPDPIFAKTRTGEYLLANEAIADAYGRDPESVEGAPATEVLPDETEAAQFHETDRQVIESQEPIHTEGTLTTADGETRVLQATKIPFETAGSGEDAVLGYARDVTELKEYEATLEKQRDTLNVINEVVRHDIRNKLQLMQVYTESFVADEDAADDERLQNVLSAAQDAVKITEMARNVTRAMTENGTDHSPVSLRPVLTGEIANVRSGHEQAEIAVDGSIPDVRVPADDMLASVFRNLLTNAIHHNDKAVPRVWVDAERSDDRVRVRIADNGPGIPEDQREKLFQEGVKGLESRGTGLGLFLVQTLVDRYGGDVWVEERGEGRSKNGEIQDDTSTQGDSADSFFRGSRSTDRPASPGRPSDGDPANGLADGDETQVDDEPEGSVFVVELPLET